MVLSLERIIWYHFNGFLHVEVFVEEPFFPAKKLLDECWEVVCGCVSFLVVAGSSSQNENMFLQKNLIGLLHYDLLANAMCVFHKT
jgi:hypothetical protein